MNLQTTISVFAASSRAVAGTKLDGFTHWQEEQIRSVLSQVPDELLAGIKSIVADTSLGAKHGRYEPETKIIRLNPRDFHNQVRFGRGPGRKLPHVDLTIAHEIGHPLFLKLPKRLQTAWKKLSGWQEGPGEGQAPPYKEKRPGWPRETSTETFKEGAKFPRRYSERNSDEDFADCFGFYVMGQKDRLSPEKQAFMAKVLRK